MKLLLFSIALVISLAFATAQSGSKASECQSIGTGRLWPRQGELHHRRQKPGEILWVDPELEEDVDLIEPNENLAELESPVIKAHHEKSISDDHAHEQTSQPKTPEENLWPHTVSEDVDKSENKQAFIPTWRRNPPPPILIPEVIDPFFNDDVTPDSIHVVVQPRRNRITQSVYNVFRQLQSRPPRVPSSHVSTAENMSEYARYNPSKWWNWYGNHQS